MRLILHILSIAFFIGCTQGHAQPIHDKRAALYQQISASVYQIYAIDKDKHSIVSLGNAVAISKRYLATNCHVALAGNFLILKVENEPYMARLCYFNQDEDLCIIDVTGTELHPVQIRASKSVKINEKVYALAEMHTKKAIMSAGEITKIIPQGKYVLLQTNAYMRPGFSGGGLFDADGRLIGITTSGISGTDIGFAISTELILEVLSPKLHPKCSTPQN